jgi:hypothetical protein
MIMQTKVDPTQRAMQKVWARHILKEHATKNPNCDCVQCRDAKNILSSF